MRYRTLRVGLALAAIGIWLALQGWQEVAADLDELVDGELVDAELLDYDAAIVQAEKAGNAAAAAALADRELVDVDELCHRFRYGVLSATPGHRRRRR